MDDSATATALLVPPVRLGRTLRDQRQAKGHTLHELAATASSSTTTSSVGSLPVALLEDIESGRASLDDETLTLVAELYGLPVSELAPQRAELIIDLDEGVLSINNNVVRTASSGTNEVLTRYLALVYSLRDLPAGAEVPLRTLDVGVLSHALGTDRIEVAARLEDLLADKAAPVESARSALQRKLVVPVAGILVGVTAIGGLVMVRSDPPAPTEISAEIGEAVVINAPGASQINR